MAQNGCPGCGTELEGPSVACPRCGGATVEGSDDTPPKAQPSGPSSPQLNPKRRRLVTAIAIGATAVGLPLAMGLGGLIATVQPEDPGVQSAVAPAGTVAVQQEGDGPYPGDGPASVSPSEYGHDGDGAYDTGGDRNPDRVGARTASRNEPDASDVLVVKRERLIEDYDKNEVAADLRYKGKTLEVTAPITSFGKSLGDEKPIVEIGGDLMNVNSVRCEFEVSDREEIAKLRKGAKITIRGTCTGKGFMSVQLGGCSIVANSAKGSDAVTNRSSAARSEGQEGTDDDSGVDPDYVKLVQPMEHMTSAQKDEYVKKLNGRQIDWRVYVADADGGGVAAPAVSVTLKPPTENPVSDMIRMLALSDRVFEFKVTKAEALRVQKGQRARMLGRLQDTSALGGILTFQVAAGRLVIP